MRPACLKTEHLPAAYNASRPDGVRACAGGAGEDTAASFLQTLLKIELVGTEVPPSWQEGVHYVMQGRKDSSKTVVKVVKTVDRPGWLSGAPRWQEGVHVMRGKEALRPRSIGAFKAS